jgi:hypothetical protein
MRVLWRVGLWYRQPLPDMWNASLSRSKLFLASQRTDTSSIFRTRRSCSFAPRRLLERCLTITPSPDSGNRFQAQLTNQDSGTYWRYCQTFGLRRNTHKQLLLTPSDQ